MPTSLLRFAMWLGAIGFVVSVGVHVATLLGDPLGTWVYALHGGVFAAFFPVVFGLVDLAKRTGLDQSNRQSQQAVLVSLLRSLPAWQKAALALVFVYAGVNFVIAFREVAGGVGPPGADTVRGFSGHWMFFYLASAVLAARLVAIRESAPDAARA